MRKCKAISDSMFNITANKQTDTHKHTHTFNGPRLRNKACTETSIWAPAVDGHTSTFYNEAWSSTAARVECGQGVQVNQLAVAGPRPGSSPWVNKQASSLWGVELWGNTTHWLTVAWLHKNKNRTDREREKVEWTGYFELGYNGFWESICLWLRLF